jgi:hypothetical protein
MYKAITIIITAIAFIVIAAVIFDVPFTVGAATSLEKATEPVALTNESYNEYISVVGTARQSDIDTLMAELSKIPGTLQSDFITGNGQFFLTDIPMTEILAQYHGIEHQADPRAQGFFIVNSGTPEIWLTSSAQAITGVALHEFAHWYDYSQNWLSGSDSFLEIYYAEKGSFNHHIDKEQHYISTPEEYFAESFSRYITSPQTLSTHCPLTYGYIKSILADY